MRACSSITTKSKRDKQLSMMDGSSFVRFNRWGSCYAVACGSGAMDSDSLIDSYLTFICCEALTRKHKQASRWSSTGVVSSADAEAVCIFSVDFARFLTRANGGLPESRSRSVRWKFFLQTTKSHELFCLTVLKTKAM
jgi:hypothetical protein